MKRADLPTADVLRHVAEYPAGVAYDRLCERYPAKIVLAAIDRDTRAGLINWGVSPAYPWLEQAGAERLAAIKAGG